MLEFYKANAEQFSSKEFAQVYIAYGDVYCKMHIHSDAGKQYRKALKQLKKESGQDADTVYITEKITKSVLEVGRRYYHHFIAQYGKVAYYLNPINWLIRYFQKKSIYFLDTVSINLLEKESSNHNRLLRARVHYNYARFYENYTKRRSFEHYQKALKIAENCEDAELFIEQCLQSIVIFLWNIYPHSDMSLYLERLIQIREKQFLNNPDKYFFALYVVYLIACYNYRHDADNFLFEKYSNKLQQIVITFQSRMEVLADVDAEAYLILSDGTLDCFLNELAYDYPEIFGLINDVYYKFDNPNIIYSNFPH